MEPIEHWQRIYTKRPHTDVGWYEPQPATSLRLVSEALDVGARSFVDIGGGGSFLVDRLLDAGLERLAVMDISEAGLDVARQRLGGRASEVEWIVGDVTSTVNLGRFDVWHDRAVFHFLLEAQARERYIALAQRTVPRDGRAIMATFSHAGPKTCSGLPVHRWEPDELAGEWGPAWDLRSSERYVHTTPGGKDQAYVYCVFARTTDED